MLGDGTYQLNGHYEFFGKKQALQIINITSNQGKIMGCGSDSKGQFSLEGDFKLDGSQSEFSINYDSYTQKFEG